MDVELGDVLLCPVILWNEAQSQTLRHDCSARHCDTGSAWAGLKPAGCRAEILDPGETGQLWDQYRHQRNRKSIWNHPDEYADMLGRDRYIAGDAFCKKILT